MTTVARQPVVILLRPARLAVGAAWIEPGELEVVAQFTEAEVWVGSATKGARVGLG